MRGKAYKWAEWNQILTNSDFRVAGAIPQKAVYAFHGNHILAEDKGFLTPNEGYAWHLTLKQSRGWAGEIKFYSILLAAFSAPQEVTVAVAGRQFSQPEELRSHAENSLIAQFSFVWSSHR